MVPPSLKFEPKYNIYACLDVNLQEIAGYRDAIQLLLRKRYVYAMCVHPMIYDRFIRNFLATAKVEVVDGRKVVRGRIIHNKIVIVSEKSIRNSLNLEKVDENCPVECSENICQ